MDAATLARWTARVLDRPLDVDGAFGAQCWDLWSHYATAVLGIPYTLTVTRAGGIAPHPGWACNVWHNAPEALGDWLARLGPREAAQPGDVAFWERSTRYPGSHVAIVLADLGDRLLTLSQNPGPPARLVIPKRALLGYLRPRPAKRRAEATTTTTERGALMALTDAEQQELLATTRAIRLGQITPEGYTYDAAILGLVQGLYGRKAEGATVDVAALAAELRKSLGDELATELADELAERLGAGR